MFSLFRKDVPSVPEFADPLATPASGAQDSSLPQSDSSNAGEAQHAASEDAHAADEQATGERTVDQSTVNSPCPSVANLETMLFSEFTDDGQVDHLDLRQIVEGSGGRQLWEVLLDQLPELPEDIRNDEPDSADSSPAAPVPRRMPRVRGKRLARPDAPHEKKISHTPQQRLLLLDSWRRSGLPAKDFAGLVGISKFTLYKWNEQFKQRGPEGLMDQPRGARPGKHLSDLTKRTILMLKESHPEWGCARISDMLRRGPALAASASSVARAD